VFALEDLLSGRGKRALLTVYVPSPSPPRFADFTIMWVQGGAVLVKFYGGGALEEVCEDLEGIEAELAFRGLGGVANLYLCGFGFFERIRLRLKVGDFVTVGVGRERCLLLSGPLGYAQAALAPLCKANNSVARLWRLWGSV